MGLHYTQTLNPDEELCGWADADYAKSLVTKKSTSGYVITMYGNPVCWLTKKQLVVAQSTTEAESYGPHGNALDSVACSLLLLQHAQGLRLSCGSRLSLSLQRSTCQTHHAGAS